MGVFIRQLLAGRDFARSDRIASQMANFVYIIGDDSTRQCAVVDPAWDIEGILEWVDREEMKLAGALVTHYHPDHVGGEIFGHTIRGLAELAALRPVPVHVNEAEKEGVIKMTGLSATDIVTHRGGDRIKLGEAEISFIHTPGHTPGSQCFLAGSSLVSGDTLFIGGCGRVDLPGGDPAQMYHSLTQVLAKLPDDTLLYPGHNYAGEPTSSLEKEKRENFYMRVASLDDWMRLMGR
jgi:hydroxyacylglutathione hydrolase